MSEHLERIVDLKKRKALSGDTADDAVSDDGNITSLERISVLLALVDHAESRTQALAGMAGTALGVFFAAFIAAFVAESSNPSPALKVADFVSEIVFVVGAFTLLRCIFQSLRPMEVSDPWNENELKAHWRKVDRVHENAARSFWIGTVLLAVSIGVLVAADVLVDLGMLSSATGT